MIVNHSQTARAVFKNGKFAYLTHEPLNTKPKSGMVVRNVLISWLDHAKCYVCGKKATIHGEHVHYCAKCKPAKPRVAPPTGAWIETTIKTPCA